MEIVGLTLAYIAFEPKMTIPAAPKALKSVVKKNRGVMVESYVNKINFYVININIEMRQCPLYV